MVVPILVGVPKLENCFKRAPDGANNCDSADDGGACGAYGAGDNDGGVDGGVGEDGQKDQMSRCCIASGHHL